jgi:glycosyltransferase involved in cell wall biosynthesis
VQVAGPPYRTRGVRSPLSVSSRRELHVRLATWDDEPPAGGQGVYAKNLRSALNDRGVRVTTTAGHGQHAMAYPRILGRGHLDMSLALCRSTAPLLTGDPNVVHVSGGPGGLQLIRELPVPVVFTAHHTYRLCVSGRQATRLMSLLEGFGYRRAARVAAVSPSTARSVVQMGVPASKIVVISPGVDIPTAGVEVQRCPGRMLFVGRLEPEKGPLDAIAIMQHVANEVPGAHGRVVGWGSLANNIRASIGSSTNPIRVLGKISDRELAQEYCEAQVVLVPSAFEGLGLVALEAMAAGAAVVGYDVTGLRETIGGHGLLVRQGDRAAMAAACKRLLGDFGFWEELSASGRDAVQRERSWEHCASQFEDLYREVLAET